MSFIVIWLHFFLQTENSQTLPLITLIYTDQKKKHLPRRRGDAEKTQPSNGFCKVKNGLFLSRLGRVESVARKEQKVLPAYSRADEYARSLTAVRMTSF